MSEKAQEIPEDCSCRWEGVKELCQAQPVYLITVPDNECTIYDSAGNRRTDSTIRKAQP